MRAAPAAAGGGGGGSANAQQDLLRFLRESKSKLESAKGLLGESRKIHTDGGARAKQRDVRLGVGDKRPRRASRALEESALPAAPASAAEDVAGEDDGEDDDLFNPLLDVEMQRARGPRRDEPAQGQDGARAEFNPAPGYYDEGLQTLGVAGAGQPQQEPQQQPEESRAEDLESLGVGKLKKLAREHAVDISGLFEKSEIIARLREAGVTPTPAASSSSTGDAAGVAAEHHVEGDAAATGGKSESSDALFRAAPKADPNSISRKKRGLHPGSGEHGGHHHPQPALVTLEGYMLKSPPLTKRFAHWRQRWFMLSGRHLLYCLSDRSELPKGMIDLLGAGVEGFKSPKSPTGYEVRVHVPERGRTYRLCPDTEMEALAWTQVIANNITVLTEMFNGMHHDLGGGLHQAYPDDARNMHSGSFYGTGGGAGPAGRRNSDTGRDLSQGEEPATFYEVLGVSPTASAALIRKEFFRLARDYRDADPELFADITAAFQVLKDDKERAMYDVCERVKRALRGGVICGKFEDGLEEPVERAFFLDSTFETLYWQEAQHGPILEPGYQCVEMSYVQHIFAGDDRVHVPRGPRRPHPDAPGQPDVVW